METTNYFSYTKTVKTIVITDPIIAAKIKKVFKQKEDLYKKLSQGKSK